MVSDTLRRAPRFLSPIAAIYGYRLREYGPSAQGVFWRNEAGQMLRFEVLSGVFDLADERGCVSINDLGSGYGAFFDFLADRSEMLGGHYTGYDICGSMVKAARARIHDPRAHFVESLVATEAADYSFVSGTFNMKLDEFDRDWTAYVEASLEDLWSKTRKGLAFNMLCARTKKRKEHDLYYADWREYETFCRDTLSPHVTLVHDYPLDEFTLYVHR